MAASILEIKNIDSVQPYSRQIENIINRALKDLIDSTTLEIDFTGTKQGEYFLEFTTIKLSKIKYWSAFAPYGSNYQVYVNAIKESNYCENISDIRTCKVRFRATSSELGIAIANTALHEIGHGFGLTNKSSYAGADVAGHTGNERNYMFDYPNHKDYSKYTESYNRAKLYTIKSGDTLYDISQKIGFVHPISSWEKLYNFKGPDGTSNKERLKSKSPDKIYPGEKIWVPDIDKIIDWYRKVELKPKEFTPVQIRKMKENIKSSKNPSSIITF